jgi:hypothetical protein
MGVRRSRVRLRAEEEVVGMSIERFGGSFDLRHTKGYLLTDRSGQLVGKVESPMYGSSAEAPDALALKTGTLGRRRLMMPADVIAEIDGRSGVIALLVDRDALRLF